MIKSRTSSPVLMPELSPGRHRNPRRGACFMEFASYLAGEKWSDHPPCTAPLLSATARLVNDFMSDAGRQRLVPLIPRVIGLSSMNPQLNLRVVVRVAAAAMPVAALERQRALAVGLLTCERIARSSDPALVADIEDALAQAPDCERWATEFMSRHNLPVEETALRRGSEAMVRLSVLGIAFACVADADDRLYDMFERVLVEYELDRTAPVEPEWTGEPVESLAVP